MSFVVILVIASRCVQDRISLEDASCRLGPGTSCEGGATQFESKPPRCTCRQCFCSFSFDNQHLQTILTLFDAQ